jgi:hypothetical protein
MVAEIYRQGMSREEVKQRLFEMQKAKPVLTNSMEGITVPLNSEGRGKMVSGLSVNKSIENGFTKEEHFAVVSDIDNLLENAIKVYEHPDGGGDPNIKAIHRLATPLQFRNGVAYITLKESLQHGKRLYSLECIKIGQLVGTLGKAREKIRTLTPSAQAAHKFHIDNIHLLESKINTQRKENPETC